MITKEQIISEIKRTAQANRGKPRGKQTFENETGVKTSDWYGKYWVRWSDALIEACFQPNKYNVAFEDDFVCTKYASLIRELNRIPVTGELRIKAKNDKSFPSHTVFSRYGSKDNLVERVKLFCEESKEWEDVLEMCARYTPKKRTDSEDSDNSTRALDGFVYLMKSGRYYKIGMTKDIHRRSREISIELPEGSDTVHVIRTDDPSGIEAYWHNRFASKRAKGEWFELSPKEVKAFRRRKFM
ncbi:GIY-YIG nuclease family protein [bacterium]|nr:GIY-YIG nuclease family protein [bacterium]